MFVGSNLVLQWVPENGKVVRGDTKMSPGKVSLGMSQRGVNYHHEKPYSFVEKLYSFS